MPDKEGWNHVVGSVTILADSQGSCLALFKLVGTILVQESQWFSACGPWTSVGCQRSASKPRNLKMPIMRTNFLPCIFHYAGKQPYLFCLWLILVLDGFPSGGLSHHSLVAAGCCSSPSVKMAVVSSWYLMAPLIWASGGFWASTRCGYWHTVTIKLTAELTQFIAVTTSHWMRKCSSTLIHHCLIFNR